MNRCHVCNGPAVNADAALCLTCIEKAERGDVFYDPDRGWRERGLTPADLKEQGSRCGCRGADDYCVCQNVPDRVTRAKRMTDSTT